MTEPPVPLTALSEAQRAQATQRFTIIRSALEDGVTQTQVASTHNISVSTVRRWVKRYREKGLAGLADAKARSDIGRLVNNAETACGWPITADGRDGFEQEQTVSTALKDLETAV